MIENLNMNFAENLFINTELMDWIKSPAADVLKKPLEREGREHGHTTSVVEYLPGAKFAKHAHPFGEEIFVLEGIFSDENGDYPAGTYIRNPPGSSHAPFRTNGCKIFVKLNQFSKNDLEHIVINTNEEAWRPGQGNLKVMPLHSYGTESVALVKWPKNETFLPHTHYGGEEIFVISGEFIDENGQYPKGSWIRNSHLSNHHPRVIEETIIMVKIGHLKK
jgi:anti-sigma factor ChrR (cupin superfamily)